MKRTLLALGLVTLTSAVLLLPRAARAEWFGAHVQGQSGYQQTNRTGHPMVGASAGVTVLGFEGFADLRFLRRDGFSSDGGWWNQLGLRFALGLPTPKIDLEGFAGISWVSSHVASKDVNQQDPDDKDQYRGFNPHVGVRLGIPLFPLVSVGAQGEVGYHYLFPNDLKYSQGTNYAIYANLRLAI